MLFLSKMTCGCSPKTLFPTDTLTWGTCKVLQKLPLTSFLNISFQGGFIYFFAEPLVSKLHDFNSQIMCVCVCVCVCVCACVCVYMCIWQILMKIKIGNINFLKEMCI